MVTTPQNGKKKVLRRSKEHQLSSDAGKVDTALEVSEIFATTAKHIADVAGVPGLGQAADIVLSILNRVQDLRDNKGEFKQLAGEARDLVVSIRDAFAMALDNATQAEAESVKKQIQELNKDLRKLVRVLKQINEFAELKAKRNLFWRFIYARYDIQTIRQYRDAMKHSHTEFNARTNVVLRVDMAQVHYKTDQILEAVKRLEEQQGRRTPSPARRLSPTNSTSSSDFHERPSSKYGHRPPAMPLVQNYSGQGTTVYNSVDNSVHDNSRVHYGDIVNTNTYNHGPAQYSQHYINGPAQFNYDQRNYGYQHRGSSGLMKVVILSTVRL
ncbi:hypothetical protein NMY22_g9541 [Coprinellus aureogranulatus]|nr:hypothetical protein NMY22_g9541 [Coprinellus aureogranulatus]